MRLFSPQKSCVRFLLTASDQSTHESDTMPLAQRLASSFSMGIFPLAPLAHLSVLPCWSCFSGQRGFVNLKMVGGNQPDIGGDAVSDGKSDEVAREEGVGERAERGTVSDEVTVMRDEFVQRFKRFF